MKTNCPTCDALRTAALAVIAATDKTLQPATVNAQTYPNGTALLHFDAGSRTLKILLTAEQTDRLRAQLGAPIKT